jgi:hypothetical protein
MNHSKKLSIEIYFSFLLKASKTYENGECPIVFRIIYRKERKDVFTGLTCPPAKWLKQEKRVSSKDPAAATINLGNNISLLY